jgi:hypothetical protein
MSRYRTVSRAIEPKRRRISRHPPTDFAIAGRWGGGLIADDADRHDERGTAAVDLTFVDAGLLVFSLLRLVSG